MPPTEVITLPFQPVRAGSRWRPASCSRMPRTAAAATSGALTFQQLPVKLSDWRSLILNFTREIVQHMAFNAASVGENEGDGALDNRLA